MFWCWHRFFYFSPFSNWILVFDKKNRLVVILPRCRQHCECHLSLCEEWMNVWERERERESVCVCVRERERVRGCQWWREMEEVAFKQINASIQINHLFAFFFSCSSQPSHSHDTHLETKRNAKMFLEQNRFRYFPIFSPKTGVLWIMPWSFSDERDRKYRKSTLPKRRGPYYGGGGGGSKGLPLVKG